MNYKEFKSIKTNILDVFTNEIYPVEITIKNGYIHNIEDIPSDVFEFEKDLDFEGILVPGFIDAHIHIESSLLTPSNFASAVVPFGTTSVVADPHEIANVCGLKGIDFMIEDASKIPFDFYFSAPSCVPATDFETNGAYLDNLAMDKLLSRDEIVALGEVMDFVGVINRNKSIIDKLNIVKKYNKPIDGHAPLLSGENLEKYVNVFEKNNTIDENHNNDVTNHEKSSINEFEDINDVENSVITDYISTDHESVSFEEAIEKKNLGMKIMVRQGSSAKNMNSLFNIKDKISLFSNQDFFGTVSGSDFEEVFKNPIFDFLVSDDKEPNELKEGHLDILVKKAINFGIDIIEAIKMVTINPAKHYNLNSGSITIGKKANFALIDNLKDLNVKKTIIDGKLVASDNKSFIKPKKPTLKNTFILNEKIPEDFNVYIDKIDLKDEKEFKTDIAENNLKNSKTKKNVRVIEVTDGEVITNEYDAFLDVKENIIQENIEEDILKLAVVERYGNNNIANAFIKGFNLKNGAIASSVAHDSHNIIVLGTDSKFMARAVNLIRENQGGLVVVSENIKKILRLPIAGLMSDQDIFTVSKEINEISDIIKNSGSTLEAPLMTLSFMALLVIPKLKLSDKGLFDVDKFSFVDLI
ncbi:Adenine deaminase [Candidatus Methanobinarius endosymbioticus]|uniref:Adenine deaminase n=1 Tax=Candidatus Methanobinarius endosymbioticus TaxID=2006182 RepID=A0A366MF84_9EURY|nr:Adenine deaminase [Candidatus Methanobinarius endosymbioticus]